MKKMSIFLISTLISVSGFADTVSTLSSTGDFNCSTNNGCNLYGSQDIEIINNSSTNNTYFYRYDLCIMNQSKCVTASNHITVNSGTKWNNHHDSGIVGYFDTAGTYKLKSSVVVTGVVNSSKEADGKITVR